MGIGIGHNGALNAVFAGANAGLQQGLQIARFQKEVEEGKQRWELAKQASGRADQALDSDLATEGQNRARASMDQSWEEEQRDWTRAARSVDEEGERAIARGEALLMKIHGSPGMSDEELNTALTEIRGIGEETRDPKARHWFYGVSGDWAKRQAIDRSMKDVVDTIGRMSAATPSADGQGETPGILPPETAERLSAGLQEFRQTHGESGLSPDDARKLLWNVQSEQAHQVVQGAAWTKAATEMGQSLQQLSMPGMGLPPRNFRDAGFVLAMANQNPPKTAEQQRVVEEEFRKALFHNPTEAELKASGPSLRPVNERARDIVMEELKAGRFTTKDDKGHANVNVDAMREREQELRIELGLEGRRNAGLDLPFEQSRGGNAAMSPTGQDATAAASASPAQAAVAPDNKGRSGPALTASPRAADLPSKGKPSRLAQIRRASLPAWSSLVSGLGEMMARGASREEFAAFAAQKGLDLDKLSPQDRLAIQREAEAIRRRAGPAKMKTPERASRERATPGPF